MKRTATRPSKWSRSKKVNAVAGIMALACWMVADTKYVFWGGGNYALLEVFTPAMFLLGALAFVKANRALTSATTMYRLAKSVLLSLPAFMFWLVLTTMTLLCFIPSSGNCVRGCGCALPHRQTRLSMGVKTPIPYCCYSLWAGGSCSDAAIARHFSL